MYSFRIRLIENVSQVGGRISATFNRMNSSARQFTAGVNTSAQAVDRLQHENEQLSNSSRRAFDVGNLSRYEGGLRGIGSTLNAVKAAVATIGGIALAKSVVTYGDSLKTADLLTAGITRNVEDVVKAQNLALKLSNQTGDSYAQSYVGLSKMLTVADGNVEKAQHLTRIAGALAAINPAEGFEAALFALKEIEGMDTMSLRERFNIRVPTQEEAKKIAARDGRKIQQVMLDSLQEQLDKSYGGGEKGAGVDYLLNVRAQTVSGQFNKITNSLKNIATPILLPFLDGIQTRLKGVSDWMSENQPAMQRFANRLIENLRPVVAFVVKAAENIGVLARAVMPYVSPLFESLKRLFSTLSPILLRVQQMFLRFVRPILITVMQLATRIFNGISGWIARNGAEIDRFLNFVTVAFGAAGDVISFNINLLVGFVKGVADMVSFYAKLMQTQFRLLQEGVLKIVSWLGSLKDWAWKNNPFSWLVDMIERVFPGFKASLADLWEGVKKWFSDGKDWIWNQFVKPVAGWFSGLFKAIGQDFSPSFEAPRAQSVSPTDRASYDAENRADAQRESVLKLFSGAGLGMGLPPKPVAATPLGVDQKLNEISGSREGVKNININIGKQIESLVFQTTKDLSDIESKIRATVEQVLLDAVNQVNYAN